MTVVCSAGGRVEALGQKVAVSVTTTVWTGSSAATTPTAMVARAAVAREKRMVTV